MLRIRHLLFIVIACVSLQVPAQSQKYHTYIAKYKKLAIEHMRKYRIPASITMAQGLLESGAGTSTLAVKGKNHFGIKCHNDWRGPYILRTDDAPNERFRKYDSVEDSYKDHSLFLSTRSRYKSLFRLSITDYEAWAHGLKAAGYATSPTYAHNLIQIIERYNLADLDKEGLSKKYSKSMGKMSEVAVGQLPTYAKSAHQRHSIGINNGNYFIIAATGDTYKSIAKEYEISERKLRKYNEVDKRYILKAGDIVYFEKKHRKAHKKFKNMYHLLQPGESVYFVSQLYGIRLKNLYKINGMTLDHTPVVGQKLKLR